MPTWFTEIVFKGVYVYPRVSMFVHMHSYEQFIYTEKVACLQEIKVK